MRRLLLVTTSVLTLSAGAVEAAPFTFVALGDMPYTLPGDYPRFERLIAEVNRTAPAFTVHVGDIKGGSSPCTDEAFLKIRDYFRTFAQPLIYTPGDNEWTDCHREKAGRFDPLERLAKVRELFFAEARSFGQASLPLEHQGSAMPEHGSFVENTRWRHEGVVFATVHAVGSNNGFERTLASAEEFFARDAANVAWIEDTFARAGAEGAPAVVIAFQADPDWSLEPADRGGDNGFAAMLKALAAGAEAFGKPVLLVQGDTHELVIDNPLLGSDGETRLTQVTRLQVMGAGEVQALRVIVDPEDPAVFGFFPLIVPDNVKSASAG